MIEDRYQLLKIIGAGAAGKVWEIQDIKSGYKYALKSMKQIEQLHAIGYIHRDIKLENILLKENKKVALSKLKISLVDFGACRKYLDSKGNHIQKVKVNSFQGNLAFASLDQMLCYGVLRNLLAEVEKIKFEDYPDYESIIKAMKRELLEIQQPREQQKWQQSTSSINCKPSPSPFTDSPIQTKRYEAITQKNTPVSKQEKSIGNQLLKQDFEDIVEKNKISDQSVNKRDILDPAFNTLGNQKQKCREQIDYQSHDFLDYELNKLSPQSMLFISNEKIDEKILNFQQELSIDQKQYLPLNDDQNGINLKSEHDKLQYQNKKAYKYLNQQDDQNAFEYYLKQINRLEMNNDFQLQCLFKPSYSQQNEQIRRLVMIDSTDFEDMEINEEYYQEDKSYKLPKLDIVYEFDCHSNNLKSICHAF
ncbi:ck1 family protein kinase [Stylonychia lemnae]|uniref:Casein kinase I n=1 Tax=Stylonychia lemnae TaxID=5949 RepID=A0A077ZVV8_STYLE|nr:ck1 family protein kinase [Stylonychia lemnae]|eukprot:CDW73385.1 ck1 family protein kinase [Stylonychia lemnae]